MGRKRGNDARRRKFTQIHAASVQVGRKTVSIDGGTDTLCRVLRILLHLQVHAASCARVRVLEHARAQKLFSRRRGPRSPAALAVCGKDMFTGDGGQRRPRRAGERRAGSAAGAKALAADTKARTMDRRRVRCMMDVTAGLQGGPSLCLFVCKNSHLNGLRDPLSFISKKHLRHSKVAPPTITEY